MKKKVRKLSLNKETVRRLTDEELKGVAGGDPTNGNTCPATCSGNTCAGTCGGPGCLDTCDQCTTYPQICQQTCDAGCDTATVC
ncbi:MAG: class I lanthipeptide [Candidatus Polarisedimenticolia bacterium]